MSSNARHCATVWRKSRGRFNDQQIVPAKAEMVIARFASHPLAGNVNLDPMSLPACRAIAEHLLHDPR